MEMVNTLIMAKILIRIFLQGFFSFVQFLFNFYFLSVGLSSEWPKNLVGIMLPSTYGEFSGYQTAWKGGNDTNNNGLKELLF